MDGGGDVKEVGKRKSEIGKRKAEIGHTALRFAPRSRKASAFAESFGG